MSSKNKETTTTTTHQEQGAEEWVRNEGKSLYDKAEAAMPEGYTKYKGTRVADYGDDFYAARDKVRGMSAESGDLDQLRTVLDTLFAKDKKWLEGSTQDHMNPYVDAALSPTLRKLDEARKLQLNEDNARATMAGAFGDPQAGLVRAESNDRYNTQISDATSAAYKDAWDRAQAQDNHVASRFADTGKGYAGLDQALFNKDTALAKFLTQFGLAEQQFDQANADVKYEDWKNDKLGGWEVMRSGLLNQLLNNTPHKSIMDGTSTAVKETDDNSGMQMLGKLAGTALGAALGGPAGAQIGGSLGGGLFGGGGGGGSSGGGGGGSFFAPMGSTVNNASTGGQFEWAPGGYFSI